MSISYCCVCEGGEIVASRSDTAASTEWAKVVSTLIKRVEPGSKKCYSYAGSTINYIADPERVYLAIADEEMDAKLVFAFLEDLKSRNSSFFDKTNSELMYDYSSFTSPGNLNAQTEMSRLEFEKEEEIGLVSSHVEELQDLSEKTDRLAVEALEFQNNVAHVERALSWSCSYKYWLLLFGGMTLFVLLIVVIVVCGPEFQCASKHKPYPQPCIVLPITEHRLKEECSK